MGKSKKFSDREKTKEDIIQKSAEMFNKKGYLSTSIQDIETCTGLSKGSIYGNFANKEEVALEVFRYNFRLLFSGIETMIEQADTAKDKLLAYVHYYRKNYRFHLDRGGCALLNVSVDVDDTNPALRAKAVKYIKVWEKTVHYLLELGTAQKEWKDNIDKQAFFSKLASLIQGGIFLSKTTGDERYLLDNLSDLETYIHSICKK